MYRHSDRFPFLSGAYYLAHYIPRSQGGNDELSSFLLQFKDNNHTAVKKWSDFAAASLRSSGVNFKVIVRALGSSETTVHTGTPLDHLGQTIAGELGAVYMPKLLSKSRQNKSLKYLSAVERAQELTGLYSFNNYGAVSGDNILLIDDVVTTGTTLKSVYSAITQSCPQVNVYFFTLAKTFDSWRDENTNSDIYSQLLEQNSSQSRRGSPSLEYYEDSETDWDLVERIFRDSVNGHINPPGPHLRKVKDGWKPAEGYVWTKSNPDNKWEVKKEPPPGPNLRKGTENGTWQPAEGYVWTNSNPDNKWEVKKKPVPSSGWCFIATACSGSYDHPDVLILRQLRDDYLLKRDWGRRFVQTYYHRSPPIADFISQRKMIRTSVSLLLIKPLGLLTRGWIGINSKR